MPASVNHPDRTSIPAEGPQVRSVPLPGASFLLLLPVLVLLTVGCSQDAIQTMPPSSQAALLVVNGIPVTPGRLLTQADVLAYIGQYAFEGGPTVSGKPPTIVAVREMGAQACEQLMKTQLTGDNRPVFFVELEGPFLIKKGFTHLSQTAPVQFVNEVFDAQTGALLEWGVLSAKFVLPQQDAPQR